MIVDKVDDRFRVADNPSAKGYPNPWYARLYWVKEVVVAGLWDSWRGPMLERQALINKLAREFKVDPDLVKAIMWMETRHGSYDPGVGGTVLPMNVGKRWGRALQYDLGNDAGNIRAAIHILKELEARIEEPTVEKVATLYNSLGDDRVSAYGKTVAYYYSRKPWNPIGRLFRW